MKAKIAIPNSILRRVLQLLHLYFDLLSTFYYDPTYAWVSSILSDVCIVCVRDFCCSGPTHPTPSHIADFLHSHREGELCQLLINAYHMEDLPSHGMVIEGLCGCCRGGLSSPSSRL